MATDESTITLEDPGETVPSAPVNVPPGVAKAARKSRWLERRIALITVVTPFVGAVIAIAWLWNRMIGPVELASLLVMYWITGTGIGVGFHRLLTHQSFQTSRGLRATLAIMGSMAAEGPPLYWSAVHRRHHQFSDREGDPHSPHLHGPGLLEWLRGFWHSHTGWMFHHEVTDWARLIPDLLRDKLLFRINDLYLLWVFLGLALPTLAGGLIHGTWEGAALGFLWGGLVRMFLVHHSTWCVNSVTHVWGSQPFRSRDYSRNNFLIAVVTLGEGWHNNHHAFPTSANAGFAWWEIDCNKYFIHTLRLLGLIWDVKVPTSAMQQEARRQPDDVDEPAEQAA